MADGTPSVLLIDDEPDIRELYTAWLERGYDVRTAADGADALDELDDPVDVILLDRQFPDRPGVSILKDVRETGVACPIAAVSGMGPDLDIVSMPIDDYLLKPVRGDELAALVSSLLARRGYGADVREYLALVSKWGVLNAHHDIFELEKRPAYALLEERIASLREDVGPDLRELSENKLEACFWDPQLIEGLSDRIGIPSEGLAGTDRSSQQYC